MFKPSNPVPWATASSRRELAKPERMIALRLAGAGAAVTVQTETRRSHVGYLIADAYPLVKDDPSWDGVWTGKAKTTPAAFRAELAIPWKTLESAGVRREHLQVEMTRVGRWGGPRDQLLHTFDRSATEVYALDQTPAPGRYTLRLHFAELDGAAPGDRVFNVLLQGKPVLKDFDVAREAGGGLRGVVKEFDVTADRQLDIQFVPKDAGSGRSTERAVPILNGLELVRR